MNYVDLARDICIAAHTGQTDRGGVPYWRHPFYVASKVSSDNEKILAYLHDVLEDTSISIDELRGYGFSSEVLDALQIITKPSGEVYEFYIQRVATNHLATVVKIEDLKHNLQIGRLPLDQRKLRSTVMMQGRYKSALEYLKQSLV